MALLARTAQKVAFAGAQRQFVARPTVALRAAAPEISSTDDAQECELPLPLHSAVASPISILLCCICTISS